MIRRKSKKIKVGNIYIGGNSEISVQSMLNADSSDISANIKQAKTLLNAGCDIIRVSVPAKKDVRLIYEIKNNLDIPLVADIHFDYRIAIECAHAGADKIRINPGNIGGEQNVKAVADICRIKNIPIRIGVNSGSLSKEILHKHGKITADALVESAIEHSSLLEKYDFDNICISIKSSDVNTMYESYKKYAQISNYPLHLGVTEAGTYNMGIIKSSAGIGGLLLTGIGDTIRFSLTDDPLKEVQAAKDLLRALDIRKDGVTVISCPTCGRTKIDIISLSNRVENACKDIKKPIKVAIMGCVVNGPGEAEEADIGICGGKGSGVIIKKGEIIKKVPDDQLFEEFMKEIKLLNEDV